MPLILQSFHSGWWEQELVPAVCELQELFSLLLSSGSFPNLLEFHPNHVQIRLSQRLDPSADL